MLNIVLRLHEETVPENFEGGHSSETTTRMIRYIYMDIEGFI